MAASLKEESVRRGDKIFAVSRKPHSRSNGMKTVGSTVGRSNVYYIPAKSTDTPSTSKSSTIRSTAY